MPLNKETKPENKLFILDRNTWYISVCKQIIKEMLWNIENIVLMTIKHLQMNQILALNNPLEVEMP